MSLLNDMLRDLSRHQPAANDTEGYDDALLQSSSLTKRARYSYAKLAGIFVIVFVIALAVNYTIHKFPENYHKQKSILSKAIIDSSSSSSAAVVSVVASQSESIISTFEASSSVPALVDKPIEDAPIELQNHINDLLQQAERAISMDRLTAPVEDNAYGYYQKILSMNANNNDAKDGLDKIAERFLGKAQEQSRLGNTQQAEALVQRARFISARYVQAHEIALNEVNSFSSTNFQSTREEKSTTENLAVQTSFETIKPFVVTEVRPASVSLNAEWKDGQMVQHAQELIQQGKLIEAQALLKNFIALENKPALSVALLADTYIQQSNTQAATIIVEKADYLPLDVSAKIKAQILSLNGDDTQAIALLEKNLTEADANEGYRSLLASLYHKTANYQQSIISYQRLMKSFGEKPAYWLGLALAYDGLLQHKSALEAYQHLREFPQLQEQVKKYTDQRIAALRSE